MALTYYSSSVVLESLVYYVTASPQASTSAITDCSTLQSMFYPQTRYLYTYDGPRAILESRVIEPWVTRATTRHATSRCEATHGWLRAYGTLSSTKAGFGK